jgi:hypothetical protein
MSRLWLSLLFVAACRTGRVEVPAWGERWFFSPDEKRIYIWGQSLAAFDIASRRLLWRQAIPRYARVVLSRSGRQLLVDGTRDFESQAPRLYLLRSDDGALLQDLLGPPPDEQTPFHSLALVIEHQWTGGPPKACAAVFSDSRLRVLTCAGWVFDFDLTTKQLARTRYLGIPGRSEHAWFHEGASYTPNYYAGLSPSGTWIVVARRNGHFMLYP